MANISQALKTLLDGASEYEITRAVQDIAYSVQPVRPRIGLETPYISIDLGTGRAVEEFASPLDDTKLPTLQALGVGYRLIDEGDLGPRIRTWRRRLTSPDRGPVYLIHGDDWVAAGTTLTRINVADRMHLQPFSVAGSVGLRIQASSAATHYPYIHLQDDTNDTRTNFTQDVIHIRKASGANTQIGLTTPNGGILGFRMYAGGIRHYMRGGIGTSGRNLEFTSGSTDDVGAVALDTSRWFLYKFNSPNPVAWFPTGEGISGGVIIGDDVATPGTNYKLRLIGSTGRGQLSSSSAMAAWDYADGTKTYIVGLRPAAATGFAPASSFNVYDVSLSAYRFVIGTTGNNGIVLGGNEAQLWDNDNSHYVGLKSPALAAAGPVLTLPSALPGAADDIMVGSTLGVLSFNSAAALSIVKGTGVNDQVAVWSGTNTLDGSANLTFVAADKRLTLGAESDLRFQSLETSAYTIQLGSSVNNGTRDNILAIGWNYLSAIGNTRIDATESALKFTMESNFNNAVTQTMEVNLDYISTDGLTTKRFGGFNVNRATHIAGWSLVGDTIALERVINNGEFKLDYSSAANPLIRLQDAAGRKLQFVLNVSGGVVDTTKPWFATGGGGGTSLFLHTGTGTGDGLDLAAQAYVNITDVTRASEYFRVDSSGANVGRALVPQYLHVGGAQPAGFAAQGDIAVGGASTYAAYDASEQTLFHRGIFTRLERTNSDPNLVGFFNGTPIDESKVRIFNFPFRAKNSGGTETQFASIEADSFDVNAGTEDGIMEFFVTTGGATDRSHLKLAYNGDVFNEDGGDIDLRAEGDNKTSCLLLDASDDEIAIDGRFSLVALTPAQITADQNDYNPESTATNRSSFWRLSSDASRTITGIANGLDGRVLVLANVGGFDVVLANQNVSSVAGNRIITGTGADVTVAADTSVKLIYDNTTARWRIL